MYNIENPEDYDLISKLQLASLTRVHEEEVEYEEETDTLIEYRGETLDGRYIYLSTSFGQIIVGLAEREMEAEMNACLVGDGGYEGYEAKIVDVTQFLKWTLPENFFN